MKYNPLIPPEPQKWLQLDETERITIVEKYHKRHNIGIPNLKLHAVFHVIVENQLAMGVEPVVATLERLQREGLDRHQAIHAISTALADDFFNILQGNVDENTDSESEYFRKLNDLTAEGYLNSPK